jgi:hypothetical protein
VFLTNLANLLLFGLSQLEMAKVMAKSLEMAKVMAKSLEMAKVMEMAKVLR